MTYKFLSRSISIVFLAIVLSACGGKGSGNTTVVTAESNAAPIASFLIVAEVSEDSVYQFVLPAVDGDGDTLTFTVVSQPNNGSVEIAGAEATYTPTENFNGQDRFNFKVNDGAADSNIATVTINIAAVNDAPEAVAVSTTTNEDTAVEVTLSGVDAENDALTYEVVTLPTSGSLSPLIGNKVIYTPAENKNGDDRFSFKVNDGFADSDAAEATITVVPVNDAPLASALTVEAIEDIAIEITLPASDIFDNDSLTFTAVSQPENGSVAIAGNKATYTPAENFNGQDSFDFKANDAIADSNVATVTINITPANDAPVVVSQAVTLDEDEKVTIVLEGSDQDGDTLTYSAVEQPKSGLLSVISGNTLTYSPRIDFYGSDSFTFKVNDGSEDSGIATVMLTVVGVDDPPRITINGANPVFLQLASNYDEEGATALDDEDGPTAVTIEGVVDTQESGTYFINYTSTDSADNKTVEKKKVYVLSGDTDYIKNWDSFIEPVEGKYFQKLTISKKGGVFAISGTTDFDVPLREDYNGLIIKMDKDDGKPIWSKNIEPNQENHFSDMEADSDGNLFVVGSTMTPLSKSDALIMRLDDNGDVLWKKTFGGDKEDTFMKVTVDSKNNAWVIAVHDQDEYDPSLSDFDFITSGFSWGSISLLKYSPEGELLVKAKFGETRYTLYVIKNHFGVTIDSNDNVYIAGYTIGPTIMKYSPDGNLVWLRYLPEGSVGFRFGRDLVVRDGFTYVVGQYHDDVISSVWQAHIIKLDGTGNTVWEVILDDHGASFHDLVVNTDGTITAVGTISVNTGSFDFNSPYLVDGFIATFDDDGNELHKMREEANGKSASDFLRSIDTDGNGNIYTTSASINEQDATVDKSNADSFITNIQVVPTLP